LDAQKPRRDAGGVFVLRGKARNKFCVMRGLDPRIHDERQQLKTLRKSAVAELPHGLPVQARQ